MSNDIVIKNNNSKEEVKLRDKFQELFKKCPIPDNEILSNLGLFIKRQDLTKILFLNDLYKQILDVHGNIIEFGVRWGQNLALFESFRGIYEPYNITRRIVGFDTFTGFVSIHEKDGDNKDYLTNEAFSVTKNYENYLTEILDYHEKESPISHIKKNRIVKGDAVKEIDKYLKENPETIIAFAYFDFDLYEPTKKCLEAIMPYITRGTIIAFDELNVSDFPGETIALKEVLGLSKYEIKRSFYSSRQSYIKII